MRALTLELAVFRVACPQCKAAGGEPCKRGRAIGKQERICPCVPAVGFPYCCAHGKRYGALQAAQEAAAWHCATGCTWRGTYAQLAVLETGQQACPACGNPEIDFECDAPVPA